jgi:transposase-like protein
MEPKSRSTYSEETKAAAMAALLAGQSVSSVAREYSIPKGTVSGWKDAAGKVADGATQKGDVGDLLMEYLRTNLRALTVQANTFSDPEWLKKQDASQLAVLHGVMTDKAVRLLEAMSAGDAQ